MTDKERLDFMMATNLSEIVKEDFLKWLAENGFFTAPASTKYHGNYEGGLFDHSFMVMNLLVELSAANGLKWKRPASPFLVGMFQTCAKSTSTALATALRTPWVNLLDMSITPIRCIRGMVISPLYCSLSLQR